MTRLILVLADVIKHVVALLLVEGIKLFIRWL